MLAHSEGETKCSRNCGLKIKRFPSYGSSVRNHAPQNAIYDLIAFVQKTFCRYSVARNLFLRLNPQLHCASLRLQWATVLSLLPQLRRIGHITPAYSDLHNHLSLEADYARRCDTRREPAGVARL